MNTLGVIGHKAGMTRVFTPEGESVPVTVIRVEANRITQIKTRECDGYSAIQMTAGTVRSGRLSRQLAGHYAMAGVEPGELLHEFRVEDDHGYEVGGEIPLDIFSEGQFVNVAARSRGKGFSGVVRRWNFSMQDATHGNSLAHRAPGSIGQCQTPGRVFKGKKMAGQMGNVRVTSKNLRLVGVESEDGVLLVRGAVPGAIGSLVTVTPAASSQGS